MCRLVVMRRVMSLSIAIHAAQGGARSAVRGQGRCRAIGRSGRRARSRSGRAARLEAGMNGQGSNGSCDKATILANDAGMSGRVGAVAAVAVTVVKIRSGRHATKYSRVSCL